MTCFGITLASGVPALVAEWDFKKNLGLDPSTVSWHSHKKVWWMCSLGHCWCAPVYYRTGKKPQGCPFCSGKRVSELNALSVVFPEISSEWHPTKNEGVTPESVSFGSHRVVWWRCSLGHEWSKSINERTNVDQGCPYCSHRRVSELNSLATKSPHLRTLWHPTKNGDLRFEDVGYGSKIEIWWVCMKGHVWICKVLDMACKGLGCPFCSGHRVCELNSISEKAIYLIKEWHPTKNEGVTPESVSFGSTKLIWWICKEGHEWQMSPNERTSQDQGCPYCSRHRVSELNSLAIKSPHLREEWHPTKNGSLKFEEVSYASSKKIWWICKEGHEWRSIVACRTNVRQPLGCPKCSRANKHSKAEVEVFKIVQFSYPDAVNGQRALLKSKKLELDIWIPSLRKAVEYNGQWCHLKSDQVERDSRKALQCKHAGIQLLTITDTEYKADRTAALIKVMSFLQEQSSPSDLPDPQT